MKELSGLLDESKEQEEGAGREEHGKRRSIVADNESVSDRSK